MSTETKRDGEKCPICDDDGWTEQWVDAQDGHDYPVSYKCPRLDSPGHAPFNATGILSREFGGQS